MSFNEYYRARDFIEQLLKMDLYGPVKEDEILDENPSQYYSVGILFPKDLGIDELDPDELRDVGKAGATGGFQDMILDEEDGLSYTNLYKPSSFAISTTIKSGVEEIKVKIQYSKYMVEEYIKITTKDGKEKSYKQYKWMRKPYEDERIVHIDNSKGINRIEIDEGLELEVHLHNIYEDGSKSITVVLVNTYIGQNSLIKDESNSFFQVHMCITGTKEDNPIFAPKKMLIDIKENEEENMLEMLYGNVKNYAIGHGCAVDYEADDNGCYRIESSFIPSYELKQMKPQLKVDDEVVQMKFLATGEREKVIDRLLELVVSYDNWIEEQNIIAEKIDDRFKDVAKKNMAICRETSQRMKEGIELLKNPEVFLAFKLTNEAMYRQRSYYLKRKEVPIIDENITWYPFQLAFILIEIESIVNNRSHYRDIVDILWFPTGGGKTEAYLGVAAFTIFYRRIKYKDKGAGVTVLMRYTLRLLTIQQFERAAALICCCNEIKEENEDILGTEEIGIGLFVGSAMTPNSLDEARINLNKILAQRTNSLAEGEGNPCQLLECPICGTKLTPVEYKIDSNGMKIYCKNEQCSNHKGAPIYLIDDDIYEKKPTFIVSTIDKFARMAWEPRIRNIFGIGTEYAPPELIIQDELHLISGPLGSIAGIYETAIDYFCKIGEKKPKIVASTATIGNAKSQVLSLYARDCMLFPPQGIYIRDSYFAVEASLDEKPGRKYVGILSPSKTPTTTLIRVYGCLQFATRCLYDMNYSPEVIDNYWTILGYFNSLRELGSAVNQVYDNVQERYSFLYNKKFKHLVPSFTIKGRSDYLEELTSRKSSAKISEILKKLEIQYEEGNKKAYDYVLASNMISVGIDIDRLGLMAMIGQTKSNAEYIQASSRVGRKNPGLVVIIYNTSRSRERSHYEQFLNFHSSIYKYVEPNSLTPFSMGSRDKALHGIYISMCRQTLPYLRQRGDAGNFEIDDENLEDIEKHILERTKIIIGEREDYYETQREIEDIKEHWEMAIENSEILAYDKYGDSRERPLMGMSNEEDIVFKTLNSMRNVDLYCNIYLEDD
ncbi:helicase-related protein [Clostridium sp. Cult3]|uniref:helicase-related protein n=1 Tax=Clostridium sp. Cult3 TaxID=2079004 RepID=UPI001F35C9DB|nr:helicase-related protein [Clostridium sp. Cult3]MCF6460759.1 hypothetical protein [Clostridium sp. Cult3]